jgi:outer membrane receptor protein involved in Fe transport
MISKKTQKDQRWTLLAGASVLAAATALGAAPAAAQSADDDDEAIIVTGSRIARQDYSAISPVTTVGAEEIEMSATLSIEQLLNDLPQVIPGNTVTSNNSGGEDFATIDLRGLGPSRTLVLIDGERVPASSTTGVVDLNTIPAGLIERVEVVTGGASAVYGSDALAGVVNFILKDDYEGAEIRSTYGSSFEGSGENFNIDMLIGGNFDNGRGNITTYASWFEREGVLQSEFDYSRLSGALLYGLGYDYANHTYFYAGITNPADSRDEYLSERARLISEGIDLAAGMDDAIFLGVGTYTGGGSATPPWGSISNNAANPFTGLSSIPILAGNFAGADTDCNPATAGANVNTGSLSFNDAGELTPYFGSSACAVPDRSIGSSRYNYAPDNYIYLPADRTGIQTFANYDITSDIHLAVMLSYVRSNTTVQLAATPITGLSIPVSSPAISGADGVLGTIDDPHADLSAALLSRPTSDANFTYAWRSNAVGPRIGTFTNSTLLSRFNLTGALANDWEWAINLSWGQSDFDTSLRNNVNSVALLQGVMGCDNIPAGAVMANCVDVDIFGPNTLTDDMAAFIRTDVKTQQRIEQNAVSAYFRGPLFELPAGAVDAVFGFEYRDDDGAFIVDDAQARGEIFGFNAQQSIFGHIDVTELYGEIRVPLLADLPFADELAIELGYRVSDYSTVGSVESYKIGLEYAPVSWLSFRSVFNRAVRAPSLIENFQAGDQGFPSYRDPCATPDVATRTFCSTDGNIDSGFVPASAYPSFTAANSQVQAFAFGNPDLSAETAETFTAGLVFQPDFLPVGDLRMSVDYYDIEITDAIVSRGAQTILNSCYGNLGSTPQSVVDCGQIVRDPGTGQVISVNTSLINGASPITTEGVDVQAEFGLDLEELFGGAPGRFTLDVLASFVESYDFLGTEIAGTTQAGIGGATPDYKTVTTVGYEVGDWAFQVRHTYVPPLSQVDALFGLPAYNVADAPELSNFDISTRWDVTDAFRLVLVVDNVTDEMPPQTAAGVFDQANTDAALYAPWVLGRTFSISGRLRF